MLSGTYIVARSIAPIRSRAVLFLVSFAAWVAAGSFAVAAAGLEADCLEGSPAGLALGAHLNKAKSGSTDSMFCAGAIYLYVQHDVRNALPWLERSANAGDQRAPLVLGILYEQGNGVRQDPGLAAHWYQKGMDNGNAAAVRRLAELYRLGLGVPHDEAKARALLDKAAKMGDQAAPRIVARQERDRAADKPGREINEKAYRAYRQKRYVQSAALYRQCAEMGHDQCQLALGVHYEYGQGLPADDRQAVFWYGKSAEQGNAIAQKALGLMFELGKGVAENWPEAFRLYASSAAHYNEGAFQAGRMYQFGMGVPQNRAVAINWYQKAAKMGHAQGAYWAKWLGDYSNCIGFRNEQEQKALGFLRCAADPVGAVFRNSAERLAYLREKGREFDKAEAEILARQAQRWNAKTESACNAAGGVWMLSGSSQGAYCR